MTYLLTLLFLKLALINEVCTQIGSNDTGKSFNYSTNHYYDMLHAVNLLIIKYYLIAQMVRAAIYTAQFHVMIRTVFLKEARFLFFA